MHKDNEKKQFEVKSTLKIFGVQKYAEIDTLINELENYCFSNMGGWNKKDNTVLNFGLYFEDAIKHLGLSDRIDVLKHLYNVSLNSNWNGAKAQKALFEYIDYLETSTLAQEVPAKETLDTFLGTPDNHFNANAQKWYFEFSGKNKPDTDKPFLSLISALYECYLFILENYTTPFLCIDKINSVSLSKDFTDNDKVMLVDRILGVFYHCYEDKLEIVYMQILDFRHELKSYETENLEFNPEFVFEDILARLSTIKSKQEQLVYLTNIISDFRKSAFEMNDIDTEYYEHTSFEDKVKNELDRVTKLIEIAKTTPTQETPSMVVVAKSEDNHTPTQVMPTPKKTVRNAIVAYYLIDAGIFEYSKSAIKERFGIATYNKYAEYSNKRISEYLEITKSVAENELKEYPKAQKLALEDIKTALLKLKY